MLAALLLGIMLASPSAPPAVASPAVASPAVAPPAVAPPAAAPPAVAPPAVANDEVIPHRRYRLDNGLEVVLHDDDTYPLVAVRVIYHVGSMHDPAGKQGVAHVLEHAMFSGSDHVGPDELYRYLLRAGASGINARTTPAATIYTESLPANQLEMALWIESDRMGFFRVAMARSTITKERAIVVEEMKQRRRGSDAGIVASGLFDLLFAVGHPLHAQDRKSLDRIEFADVAAMHRQYYGPANATLVLSGSLPVDIRALVETYFGTLEGGRRPPRPARPQVNPTPGRARLRTSLVDAPTRFIGWRTPSLYEPGDADADVVAELLRSYRRAVGSSGTSSVATLDARQSSNEAGSAFIVRLGGHIGADPSAMSTELEVALQWIAAGGFSDAQLRAARRRCQLAIYRRLGSIEDRADLMAGYIVAGKSPDWVTQDVQRYHATTRESVAAFVRTQLLDREPAIATLLAAEEVSR